MEISQVMSLMESKIATQISVDLLKTSQKLEQVALALIPSSVGNNIDTRA